MIRMKSKNTNCCHNEDYSHDGDKHWDDQTPAPPGYPQDVNIIYTSRMHTIIATFQIRPHLFLVCPES